MKITLHEVIELGVWNNFRNICQVIQAQDAEIKTLNKTLAEQQKHIYFLFKEIQKLKPEEEYISKAELPKWMKHEVNKHV